VPKCLKILQIREIATSIIEEEIIRSKIEMIPMIAAQEVDQTNSAYYPIAANPTSGTIPLK
jgi:hypothetical protein